jgi:gallate decarboxylase subunit D
MPAHHYELSIHTAAGKGKHRVHAAVQFMGADILLSIWGGSMPHIGSVAITQPRPSLQQNQKKTSCTSSVYNFTGHKDEAVARGCAEKIAAASNKNTMAVAGIHIDNAVPADIAAILKNVDAVCAEIIKKLGAIKCKKGS